MRPKISNNIDTTNPKKFIKVTIYRKEPSKYFLKNGKGFPVINKSDEETITENYIFAHEQKEILTDGSSRLLLAPQISV